MSSAKFRSGIVWLLPIAVGVAGVVPGVNIALFSGHGGLGWFILPFVVPIAVIGTVRTTPVLEISRRRTLILAGSAITLLLLAVAETRIREWSGLEMPRGLLPGLAALPFGLPFAAWGLMPGAGAPRRTIRR